MEARTTIENEDIFALVERIKQGDREAFVTVTRLYQKKVFLLAFSFFGNKEDALDVVQETFLRFFQKANLFQKGNSFQTWLLQIAKNICVDYYRKYHRKEKNFERKKHIEEMDLSEFGGDDGNYSDFKEVFSRCLKRLSEKQRMIFVMKHFNQFKYREIAQILNIAQGTAKSLHFKAVQNLKALMSPYLGERYESL
ncbi:RNA polymerase sigma factor [Acidobacteriota bacterium]